MNYYACGSFPQGLVYHAGYLYVADTDNHVLRMVSNFILHYPLKMARKHVSG